MVYGFEFIHKRELDLENIFLLLKFDSETIKSDETGKYCESICPTAANS